MEIVVDNVNCALSECLNWLYTAGVEEPSRNGPVVVSPEPVMITYRCPWERVLFSPIRDANPFFHLFESLWMLAGWCDIAFPAMFNKRFKEYSDDGISQWGAYGARWRNTFEYDQLELLVQELKEKPNTRRAVLGMWNPFEYDGCRNSDLHVVRRNGKDVPCNTHIYFDRRGGNLNMTVCNRSNDLIWGACGANAVHFSILQEYLARWIGCAVGTYRQFSNNLHVYTEVYPKDTWQAMAWDAERNDLYNTKSIYNSHIVSDIKTFDTEVQKFIKICLAGGGALMPAEFQEPFIRNVAIPMFAKWKLRTEYSVPDLQNDWLLAGTQWVERRALKAKS